MWRRFSVRRESVRRGVGRKWKMNKRKSRKSRKEGDKEVVVRKINMRFRIVFKVKNC
jgi:hypothetical protein